MVVLSVCLNIFENKKEGKYFRKKKKSSATAHKIPKNHPPAKKNTPKNTQVLKKNKKYSKKLLKYFRKIKNTIKKNSYPGSSSKKKKKKRMHLPYRRSRLDRTWRFSMDLANLAHHLFQVSIRKTGSYIRYTPLKFDIQIIVDYYRYLYKHKMPHI